MPASDEVTELLATASKAIVDEKWNKALTAAQQALAADPANRTAQEYVDQATSELANEQTHKQFTAAVGSRDYTKVAELYRRIDPESAYKVMAQPDHDRLKTEFVARQGRDGRRMADRGRCKDQERRAIEVARVWPEAGRAVLSTPCKTGGQVASTGGSTPGGATAGVDPGGKPPNGSPGAGTKPPGGAPGSNGGSTAGGATFDQLLDQSAIEARNANYDRSLQLCEQALEKRPGDQGAYRTCGLAACRLRNLAKARKYIRKLNKPEQQIAVSQICMQEGISDL
jgi:tetratricopeptide (TPR) repeat protein